MCTGPLEAEAISGLDHKVWLMQYQGAVTARTFGQSIP